jgi:hypothetical protein
MICFLRSAPNLEKLKILVILNVPAYIVSTLMVILLLLTYFIFLHSFVKIYVGKEQKVEANGEFLNAQWTDGMCANLHI